MSTLVAQSHTFVDRIPLGRRIEEIKKEKGKYYSTTAMASRIGLHEETLRLMLKGRRDIYSFELDKIAHDLKMSIERILQEDICSEVETLKDLLKKPSDSALAVQIAQELERSAIGLSETCFAQHRLGHALFLLHKYGDSHTTLLSAHQLALQINEKYGEAEWLYRILFNLLDTFTACRDYANASRILQEVEPAFHKSPSRFAALNYLHAKMKESLGDFEGAKALAYQSIKSAELSGNVNLLGRTSINAAHYEYLTQNYTMSKELLEVAVFTLADDALTQLIAKKELVKTLLKLEESDRAEQEISSAMEVAKQLSLPEMEGKLWLLLARTKNEPAHAENVVHEERFGKMVRSLACKFLTRYYERQGDSFNFLKYHKITEELNPTNPDILDEGEL